MLKKTIIILIISFYSLYAQSFDGIGLGMAGNYTAISKGINSITLNPANLALVRGNNVEVNLFSLRQNIYNNSFSYYEYNRYFTAEGNKGFWTEYDKNAIIYTIQDDGIEINQDFTANILGFAINNFAFAVQAVEQGAIHLASSKRPFEIALFGDDLTKNYSYSDPEVANMDAYSAIKFTLGYAYPLNLKLFKDFYWKSVGMNFNYLVGTAVAQSLESDIYLHRKLVGDDDTDVIMYRANFNARFSIPGAATEESEDIQWDETSGYTCGRGMGIDLGVNFNFAKKWDFSWSVNNLFTSINWNTNTMLSYQKFSDSLKTTDLFNGEDSPNEVQEDSIVAIGDFSTPLPSVMRLGAAYHLLNNLVITAEYRQGFDNYFGNTTTPRFGAGVQYIVNEMFPLRCGVSFGGKYGYLLGLGTGFYGGFFHFDISTAISRAAWPSSTTGIFSAINFKFVF
jgi:hypothetical protein